MSAKKLKSFPAQTARLSQSAALLRLGHLFGDGPAAQNTKDELAAQISRQIGPTEVGLEIAAVVAGCAGLQQTRRPQNTIVKRLDHTERAASSEVASRLMSLGDMFGPLRGMPDSTIPSAQVAINSAAPTGEWQNKTLSSSQESWTGVASELGYGPPVRVGFQPRLSRII